MQRDKGLMKIVIVGNEGSGTTTLTRRLVCRSRFVHGKPMNKNQAPELETDTSTPSKFETNRYQISIQPRPQYRDFIRTCVSPPNKVDCAIVVVSAVVNEFETSMGKDGQLREHLLLAFTQGIKVVIVAVNKMDATNPPYSEERFSQIRMELSTVLQKVGYQLKSVTFVPISCYDDDNVIEVSEKMPWYYRQRRELPEGINGGTTLLENLDAIDLPLQPVQKPLRLPVQDIFNIRTIGTVLTGRVETGVLRTNMLVSFAPSNTIARVTSIELHEKPVDHAIHGDSIAFQVEGGDVRRLRRGDVCSDAHNEPAQTSASFVAQIIVLDGSDEIRPGYRSMASFHTAKIRCELVALLSKVDRRTGRTVESSPASIKVGDAAMAKLVLEKALCIEKYADYPTLGRFALRNQRMTIAVGMVKEVDRISLLPEPSIDTTSTSDEHASSTGHHIID